MKALAGRKVVVTGASSGIGAATAEAFARQGASVVVVARSRDGLEVVAARARAHGVAAHVVCADLSQRTSAEAAVREAVALLGGLDVLVLNAAAMVFGPFWEVEPDDFDRTIDVTFRGAVDVTRAALPFLVQSGDGAIVATGSIAARIPLATFSSYSAAKHALRGFFNSLRVELQTAKVPVTVSMVHPGLVNTPLWDNVSSAVGRLPRRPPDAYAPEEIARALVACATTGRDELTIGGEARAGEIIYAAARPLASRVLGLIARYHHSGSRPAAAGGLLHEPTGTGDARGSVGVSRPSLWGRLRTRR